MRPKDLIAWLDAKMAKAPGKLIPPDKVTRPMVETIVRGSVETWMAQIIGPELAAQIDRRESAITRARDALERRLAPLLAQVERLKARRHETVSAAVAEVMDLLALPPAADMIEAELLREPLETWRKMVERVAAATSSPMRPRREDD
jgi:hypothetical protein